LKKKFIAIKLNRIIALTVMAVLLLSGVLSFFVYHNVYAKEKEGIKVPIIMYHSVLNSHTGKYVISPSELESDLKYIKDSGYTTITMTDLIEYVYNDRPLPEKPIILTFDDGCYNNYYYAVPLLEKYNMKAVFSIVGEYTDKYSESNEVNINYSYLRWADISMLVPDGVVEFQSHSYAMHTTKGRNGAKKKLGESLESYKEALKKDSMKLQDEFQKNCYYMPNTYTYPFGAISKESDEIMKEIGFKATLGCTEGINYITKDPNGLFSLRRYNRSGKTTTDSFFNKIKQ